VTNVGRDLRTTRFWRHFLKDVLAAIGLAATLLGLYEVLIPGRIKQHAGTLVLVVTVASLSYATWHSWPRPVQQRYSKPNTEIRIVEGDLLAHTGHLVIGTCDTFDTATPTVISRDSLQGKFLERLYGGDAAELDKDLEVALANMQPAGQVTKPGKTSRYPIGTVAAISQGGRRFFFLAYTKMDEKNVAQATVDGIWLSLWSLWESVSALGNGEPVAIPVLGGGLARVSQYLPAQDSIRFIALSFMLSSRYKYVCERLDIVVQKSAVKGLDLLEIQAFLTSLRES
jgi:Domain of unknown function (DUF6430)